jgi:hypothetical protein
MRQYSAACRSFQISSWYSTDCGLFYCEIFRCHIAKNDQIVRFWEPTIHLVLHVSRARVGSGLADAFNCVCTSNELNGQTFDSLQICNLLFSEP